MREFEARNEPVVFPARARPPWRSRRCLLARCAGRRFHAGGFSLRLEEYLGYLDGAAAADDQPLYLFDRNLEGLERDLAVPAAFAGRDLFDLLEGELRPHFRWLVLGGRRSGSQWHVDPNGTCAWNMVLYGSKRWALLPPGAPPPGVFANEHGTHVTGPLSLGEWYASFFEEARRRGGMLECTVRAGEVVRAAGRAPGAGAPARSSRRG